MVTKLEVELTSKLVPVSTSVMIIPYCLMMPFCSLGGGGSQDSKMDSELEAFPA